MKDLIVRHLDVFPGELLGVEKSSGRILLILVLAWIALVRRAIRVLRRYLSRNFTDVEVVTRIETLGRVFRYIADVVLRCRFKVRPLEQWTIRREYLRHLKRVVDEHGVEIPLPHVTLYAGEGKCGIAAPLRVLQVAGGAAPRAA